MNKVQIDYDQSSIGFSVQNVKYFLGSDYNSKYRILSTIKQHVLKAQCSEYSEDNFNRTCVTIDNVSIDSRLWCVYEVVQYYDLQSDLKLGSKSIVLKYLEACLKNIEFDETMNTINILMKQLNNEAVLEMIELSSENGIQLVSKITDFNLKILLKSLEIETKKDDLSINQYDMTYEEIILFQLNMIHHIYENTFEKKGLIILDIPFFTTKINQFLSSIKLGNIMILCVTNKITSNMNVNDVFLMNKGMAMDFADDVAIYNDLVLNLPISLTMDEARTELKNLFDGKESNTISKLKEIIFPE
jgi:hypothetical protein